MADLLISTPDGTLLHQCRIDPARTYWIGRSPKCDIVLNAPSISRRHLVLCCHLGVWRALDAGSQDGLHTGNGDCRVAQLSVESWVRIGGAVLWLRQPEPEIGQLIRAVAPKSRPIQLFSDELCGLSSSPDSLSTEPIEEPPARPMLIITNASGGVELVADLSATAGRLVIGSASTCDIVVADDSVALIHAVLVRGSRSWSLLDAGGGVFASGKKWPRKRLDDEASASIGVFSIAIRTPKTPCSTVPFVPPATVPTQPSAFLEDTHDEDDERD